MVVRYLKATVLGRRVWLLTALASVVLYIAILNQWFSISTFPFDVRVDGGKKAVLTTDLQVAIPGGPSPYNCILDADRAFIRLDFFEVENVYALFQNLKRVRFFAHNVSSSSVKSEEMTVVPDYGRFMCECEVYCFAAAQLSLPSRAGTYEVIAEVDGKDIPIDRVTLTTNSFGKGLNYVPRWAWVFTNFFREVLVSLFILTLIGSLWVDHLRYITSGRIHALLDDFVARAFIAACTSFAALSHPEINKAFLLLALYMSVLPAKLFINPLQSLCNNFVSKAGQFLHTKTGATVRYSPPLWVKGWLALIAVATIGLFVYVLCHNNTFNWAIYEERDFVRASDLARSWSMPVVGPELLQGGQTPGGLLYLILAPFTAIRNYPDVFSWLNKGLFIASAAILYLLISRYLSKTAAVLSTILFCTSQVIYALSFWPIHPSMSVFFFLCFLYCTVRGFVEQNGRWILLSAFTLGILLQFHFSYYLSIVPFGILIWQFKCPEPSNWAFKKSRIVLAVVAIYFVLFAPYLISEALGDFANTRAIMSRDRATPCIGTVALWGGQITPASATWLSGTWGTGKEAIGLFVVLALLGGLIGVTRTAIRDKDTPNGRFALAVLLLSAIPFTLLALSGAGYHCRHTLPFALVLFVLCAYGFNCVAQWKPRFTTLILSLCATGIFASWLNCLAQESSLRSSWLLRGSEWAGEFKDRRKVARYLIKDLGLSPTIYERHALWWNYAYGMDPTVYRLDAKRFGQSEELKAPAWLSNNDLVVINSTGAPLPFLNRRYTVKTLNEGVADRSILLAHPRRNFGLISPSGNSRNAIELSTLEREISAARMNEGFSKVDNRKFSQADESYQHFLLGLGERARIRLLISILAITEGDHTKYFWKLNSPSLGKYFQEAKTIWKPRFTAETQGSGVRERRDLLVADDVIGNILFKTPLEGTFVLDGKKTWKISFGIDGYFDQSSMKCPTVQRQSWSLGVVGVNRLASAPKRLASAVEKSVE